MFSPARIALYMVIVALSLMANEATAQTCAAGKFKSCSTSLTGLKTCWCVGSQVCDVTVDQDVFDYDPISAICSITGVQPNSINPPPDGADGGQACVNGLYPKGNLVCSDTPPPCIDCLTPLKAPAPTAGTNGIGKKLGQAKHDCKHTDANGHLDPGCFGTASDFQPDSNDFDGIIVGPEIDLTCANGICRGSTPVLPPDGNALCADANEATPYFVDFTASQMIGIVEVSSGATPLATVYQLCTRTPHYTGEFQCVLLSNDPTDFFSDGEYCSDFPNPFPPD